MAYINTENGETKKLIKAVRDARENLALAELAHNVNETSMYKYCKTYDALIKEKNRLERAYAALGDWLYHAL